MIKDKKVLIITPSSQHIIGFRAGLIKALKSAGNKVSVIAFDGKFKTEAEKHGVNLYCVADKNRGINPFLLLSLKNKYYKIIKEIKPDVVFTFVLKPNTFGVLAAKKAGVKNIYSMVEGAGDVFINNGLKWRFIRKVVCALYKKSFKNCKKVFFLNEDDRCEFLNRKLVDNSQCEIVRGIGVNLEKFAFKPIKNHKNFIMVARLLKNKGVIEYCKCAEIVKQKYPEAVFNYLGSEGTVKLADIQKYINNGTINYLGVTNDVRPYLEDSSMLILPSYREGMPMSIMEAEAMGRGIITSDGVGCKDTVENCYNGFIIPRGDYKKMAEKVIWCIENPAEIEKFGKNARTFAEQNFDSKVINSQILNVLGE